MELLQQPVAATYKTYIYRDRDMRLQIQYVYSIGQRKSRRVVRLEGERLCDGKVEICECEYVFRFVNA